MAKGGQQQQTVTNSLDPATEAMRRQVFEAAQRAGGSYGAPAGVPGQVPPRRPAHVPQAIWDRALAQGAGGGRGGPGGPGGMSGPYTPGSVQGVDSGTQSALDYFGTGMGFGRQGMAALGGDAGAAQQFMNPYQGGVLDAISQQYGDQRKQVTMGVNDQATQARAFGGDRHGIALGTALSESMKNEMQAKAGLTYQGFNDAMGRAGQAANLGFGAAGQMPALGQYSQMMSDPNLRMMSILSGAVGGMPYGSSQSQPINRNRMAGALGGAAMGGAQFGPWGALGGGILGGWG